MGILLPPFLDFLQQLSKYNNNNQVIKLLTRYLWQSITYHIFFTFFIADLIIQLHELSYPGLLEKKLLTSAQEDIWDSNGLFWLQNVDFGCSVPTFK